MSTEKYLFDHTKDGRPVHAYKISRGDISVTVLDYGATLHSFTCPDKSGAPTDIVLGFDKLKPYEEGCGYIGATVGRFANRIEKGRFALNGKQYNLFVNNGPNHLHGGKQGFSSKIFDVCGIGDSQIKMSYTSPDLEEGYPGKLDLTVTFSLQDGGVFKIEYNAESDADTVINLTNHSYFNLNGADSGESVDNHKIAIFADSFCENDTDCLPTGKIIPVDGTDMDLRKPVTLGGRLGSKYKAISDFGGYDNCFIMHTETVNNPLAVCAKVHSEKTGITLECATTLPAIQLYTGNCIESDVKDIGKYGVKYKNHGALCLETQNFPNSTEHGNFPSPVLKKGEKYHTETCYRVSTEK